MNGNPTKTATIAKALNIAKVNINKIIYLDLLEERDPTRWLSDDTLRFLGELREATDPRYDILKARAAKLASIKGYMLDTHISRVIATQQGIDGPVIEDALDDLLATDLPEPRWAIQELLPEGMTILGGKKNAGKSMVAFNTLPIVWPMRAHFAAKLKPDNVNDPLHAFSRHRHPSSLISNAAIGLPSSGLHLADQFHGIE